MSEVGYEGVLGCKNDCAIGLRLDGHEHYGNGFNDRRIPTPYVTIDVARPTTESHTVYIQLMRRAMVVNIFSRV